MVQDQKLESATDTAPTSVALSILENFAHVIDVSGLSVPSVAPASGESIEPPKFNAGKLIPLVRAHCHMSNLCALGAFLDANMFVPETSSWEDGSMVDEQILVAVVLQQRTLSLLDECTASEVAWEYASVKLTIPFATLSAWSNSFRLYNVRCEEAILRKAVKNLRDVNTQAATLELVSSLDICFNSDKTMFEESTAFVMTDGQLNIVIDAHNKLKASRVEVKRLQSTLNPTPKLKVHADLQSSLLVCRNTLRRCNVALVLTQGCDILRDHRHATTGDLVQTQLGHI